MGSLSCKSDETTSYGREFNLLFNSKLEWNPTLKITSSAKLTEFKETYDLCDIWRVRNTKSKRFKFYTETFFKLHST